ncbi:MAG TPA: GspH/FimT family pseudopilin [Telluria sp.]|nr:GspH/FimT family pseudopilin [Telluria sp.]
MKLGFTLMELLVALAIVAILSSAAAPSLQSITRRIALQAAVGDLYGAIELARSNSINHAARVVVAPDDSAGIDWTGGWSVFVDRDGDSRVSDGDRVLLRHPALPHGMRVSSAFTQPGRSYIAYNAAGRSCTAASSSAVRAGSLTVEHGGEIRRIKIALLGRARVCNPSRDRSCAD